MGEYKEKLESGGSLVVNDKDWFIEYYFPGPDLRYNGSFVRIPSKSIDKYIEAWKNNFATYVKLKELLNLDKDSKFQQSGEEGMIIRIGGIAEGVFIANGWTMNVTKKERIDKIINDYENSKERAIEIQKMLKTI